MKTIKQDDGLKDQIEEMKEREKEHLDYFEREIQKRKIKPTYLLPLWDLMGVSLVFGTALLGKKASRWIYALNSALAVGSLYFISENILNETQSSLFLYVFIGTVLISRMHHQ